MGLRLWTPPQRDSAADGAVEWPAVPVPMPVAAQAPTVIATTPSSPSRVMPSLASPVAPLVRAPAAQKFQTSTVNAHGMDWPTLRAAVADCRACTLCDSRTQTVFGVGHQQAHWLVVGEAPGEQEDLQGEPFVGPSGQLLDRMLAALRLSRTDDGDRPPAQRAYIANTLKCRPPRNRNPTAEELAQCEPFLVRQIQLLRPRIILAMGRFAVQALLRSDEPIGKLRGRVHQYEGVPLVVTYHPAYLLRNLPDKAKAWEDLCLAADVAERPDRPSADSA